MKKTLQLFYLLIIIISYGCNSLNENKIKDFINDRNKSISKSNIILVYPFTLKISKLIQNGRTTYRFEAISNGKDEIKYHIKDFNEWLVDKGYFINERIHSEDFEHSYAVDPYIYFYGDITAKGYEYFTSSRFIYPQTNVGGKYTSFAFVFTTIDDPVITDIQKQDKNARVTYFNKFKWNDADYVIDMKDELNVIKIPSTKVIFMDVVKYDDGWKYTR